MSNEDDEKELELKDLIVQTLESNGLLSKIKVKINPFDQHKIINYICIFKIKGANQSLGVSSA